MHIRSRLALAALVARRARSSSPASPRRTRELSPPVVVAKQLQLFTLAVPTEKAGDDDADRADPADGLQHRLVRAVARLEADGAADGQRRGRGDPEGHLERRQRADRRGLDVLVPRAARGRARRTRSASSRPTPTARSSTGPGPESSDTPAPTIEAKSTLGGGSGSSTLAIVALIVGARRARARRRRPARRREARRRVTRARADPVRWSSRRRQRSRCRPRRGRTRRSCAPCRSRARRSTRRRGRSR